MHFQSLFVASALAVSTLGAALPNASPAAEACSVSFSQLVLDNHNNHRANHSAPSLSYNANIASKAQAAAASCTASPNTPGYGRNSEFSSGSSIPIQNAIATWYNSEEAAYTSYGEQEPSNQADTGHFTQLVWKATTQVGCAVASCPNGVAGASGAKSVAICLYSPAGNVQNEYAANVEPPLNRPFQGPVC